MLECVHGSQEVPALERVTFRVEVTVERGILCELEREALEQLGDVPVEDIFERVTDGRQAERVVPLTVAQLFDEVHQVEGLAVDEMLLEHIDDFGRFRDHAHRGVHHPRHQHARLALVVVHEGRRGFSAKSFLQVRFGIHASLS